MVITSWGDSLNNELSWHIVIGASEEISVKLATNSSKALAIKDNLSYGPISHIENTEGQNDRLNWLKENMTSYDHYSYEELKQLKNIESHEPIIIWTADNASEQTGLRFLMYLLRDWSNDIYILNTSAGYKKLFGAPNVIKTTEINIDQLKEIYEKVDKGLVAKEKNKLIDEWKQLSQTKMNLRSFCNHTIVSKDEAAYDSYIIETARKTHFQMKKEPYIKSARLVGEVYGELRDFDDLFIEYRVRKLIEQGQLEYRGDLSAMRFYEVRLADIV